MSQSGIFVCQGSRPLDRFNEPFEWCRQQILEAEKLRCTPFSSLSLIIIIKKVALATLGLLFYLPFGAISLLSRVKIARSPQMENISKKAAQILCVDVGGSRIKCALLSRRATLEDLKNTSVSIYDSSKWLNGTFPKVFEAMPKESITSSLGIHVAMPGKIIDHAFFERDDISVPRSLKDEIEKNTGVTAFLESDDVTWLRGMIEFQKLRKKKIQYPCACIAIGTGVAVSIALSDTQCVSFQIEKCREFKALERNTGVQLKHLWEVHQLIGREFFATASENQMSESSIREEHTKRVSALIEDLMNKFREDGINIESLFIGGGNSRYLTLNELKTKHSDIKIVGMTPSTMQKHHINMDLIPLLGLAKMFPDHQAES